MKDKDENQLANTITNGTIDQESFIKEAKAELDRHGFYIAKNLIKQSEIEKLRSEAITYFSKVNHEKKLSYALRGSVGSGIKDIEGFTKNKTWHVYRSCFFTWNKPVKGISSIINTSREISMLRNKIKGIEEDYGINIETNGDIAYTSLSKYPPEGGFLGKHADGDSSQDILHFKVELSRKGIDYECGGFIVEDKQTGKEVDISSIVNLGDVVFFKGEQPHGINKIKGGEIGRIAFFEIPTSVTQSSRNNIYTDDGWSLYKRALFRLYLKAEKISYRTLNQLFKKMP